jgi:hypothetical protein
MPSATCLFIAEITPWPSPFDLAVLVGFVVLIVGIPLAGYVLLAVDIRAHYRRLRGALVLVSNYMVRMPAWVAADSQRRKHAPPCLATFGLKLPCSEDQLLNAYRQLVKTCHPDLGGDRNEFLKLQQHFEQARTLVMSQALDD